jgi:nicotinamide-nucleotide amidase
MATGIIKLSGADLGIAVTGIAGPGGGSDEKPVGLVYIALAVRDSNNVICKRFMFNGNREQVRNRTVSNAFDMIRRQLNAQTKRV